MGLIVIFLHHFVANIILNHVENEAANFSDYIFFKMQKTLIFTIFSLFEAQFLAENIIFYFVLILYVIGFSVKNGKKMVWAPVHGYTKAKRHLNIVFRISLFCMCFSVIQKSRVWSYIFSTNQISWRHTEKYRSSFVNRSENG